MGVEKENEFIRNALCALGTYNAIQYIFNIGTIGYNQTMFEFHF